MMERWAGEHFGATGKMKDAAKQGYDIVRKLPVMLRSVENAMKSFGDPDGIRLHSLSIAEIHAGRRALYRPWLLLGWAALTVTLLALFLHYN